MWGLTAVYLSQLKSAPLSQKPGQSHDREWTIDQLFEIGTYNCLKKDKMLKLDFKPPKTLVDVWIRSITLGFEQSSFITLSKSMFKLFLYWIHWWVWQIRTPVACDVQSLTFFKPHPLVHPTNCIQISILRQQSAANSVSNCPRKLWLN